MVTLSPRWPDTVCWGSRVYITRSVSSYSATFAPGTSSVHSGISPKASSALQLLETSVPDHAPLDFVVLFCLAATAATQESAARQSIEGFVMESDRRHRLETLIAIDSAGAQ